MRREGAEDGPEARSERANGELVERGRRVSEPRRAPLALQHLSDARRRAPPVTREQRRSRRKRAIRARTISVKRMTKRELELGRMLYPEVEDDRAPAHARASASAASGPARSSRASTTSTSTCRRGPGAIKLNFPDLEVWEMTETCALDVADRGGTTLEEVGAIMNLTRERIRQVEVKGLAKLAALRDMSALRDYVDEGPIGKRRLPVLAQRRTTRTRTRTSEDAEDADEVARPSTTSSVDVETLDASARLDARSRRPLAH